MGAKEEESEVTSVKMVEDDDDTRRRRRHKETQQAAAAASPMRAIATVAEPCYCGYFVSTVVAIALPVQRLPVVSPAHCS